MVAQDVPVVVLYSFWVSLAPMVALDLSIVALGLSGFPHGGPGFLCGLQVPPWWPWVSVNPPMLAQEPAGFCRGGPGALRGDSLSYGDPRALYCDQVGS